MPLEAEEYPLRKDPEHGNAFRVVDIIPGYFQIQDIMSGHETCILQEEWLEEWELVDD